MSYSGSDTLLEMIFDTLVMHYRLLTQSSVHILVVKLGMLVVYSFVICISICNHLFSLLPWQINVIIQMNELCRGSAS